MRNSTKVYVHNLKQYYAFVGICILFVVFLRAIGQISVYQIIDGLAFLAIILIAVLGHLLAQHFADTESD